MKPVIYKPLQQALFDATAESLIEYVAVPRHRRRVRPRHTSGKG